MKIEEILLNYIFIATLYSEYSWTLYVKSIMLHDNLSVVCLTNVLYTKEAF